MTLDVLRATAYSSPIDNATATERTMADNKVTLHGKKLTRDGKVVAEIVGHAKYTAKWGRTGPGYAVRFADGSERNGFWYFDDAVRAARESLAAAPTEAQLMAAIGPCGK